MLHSIHVPRQVCLLALVAFLLAPLSMTIGLASGTWSPTGSMSITRNSATATLLPDGRVLVNGGNNASGALASAEIYDPALGTWSLTGSMSTARYGHTATLLPGGRVLVSGGYSGSAYLASAEIYDPTPGTWSLTGSMSIGRYGPTATLLPDGRVLVSGGEVPGAFYVASAEIYDPSAGTWSLTGSMSTARCCDMATLLPNGRVLVSGGHNGSSYLASAEIYDPTPGTWSLTGSMSTARCCNMATPILLPDGRVLFSGGLNGGGNLASAEIYDPGAGTWSLTGSMSAARWHDKATLLPGGRVLVSGGYSGGVPVASAEVYDPALGTWSLTDSMSTARGDHTATLLLDGRVLVSGGASGSAALASAEIFDITPPVASPVTTASLSPPANGNGWNNGNVLVTLNATASGSATVASITYALSGAPGNTVVAGNSASFTVSAEGTTTVTYHAIDSLGNVEADQMRTVRIDRMLPIITPIPDQTIVADSPAGGSFTFIPSATDNIGGSGVVSVTATPPGPSFPNGATLVTMNALDAAGNGAVPVTFTVTVNPQPIASDTWATMASDPHPKYTASSVEIGGLIYVSGWILGAPPLLSIYNPVTNTWTLGAPPPLNRAYTSVGVIDGKMYVLGGCIDSDCRIGLTNVLEVYDPLDNSWSIKTPMPTTRFGVAVGVIAGNLYVTGGATSCGVCLNTNVTEIYDPVADAWSTGVPIPAGRTLALSAVVDGRWYVIGGSQQSIAATVGTVHVYDPVTSSWSTKSPMPTPRYGAAVGVIDGEIYVVGGINDSLPYLAVNESYDPGSDMWTARMPMPTARRWTTGSVVNSKLYVVDGFNGSQLGTNEEYSTELPSIDTDLDGIPDNADPDDDGDGVSDAADAFPLDPAESVDTDGDGTGNNADADDDNDGTPDTTDAFPLDAAESVDTDLDGIGDNADPDDDGDGVPDATDAFPLNATESVDTDLDGTGNNADPDDDGDGVADGSDAFPLDALESVDTDGDGTGNNADLDDDGDLQADADEASCGSDPLDSASMAADFDSDSSPNCVDVDDDNDGVADISDAFPLNSSEWMDTDSDGLGNNADADDDNDGIADGIDTQSLISSNAFSDVALGGTTSGTITSRGGWTVLVTDANPGGIEVTTTGAGAIAAIDTCAASGAERVELDGNNETAAIECVTTTGVNTGSRVTAISATAPAVAPRIIVRDAAGKVQAKLKTGNVVTIGSPVTAGSTNAEPILVELLDDDGVVFGSFELPAGYSVNVRFDVGPDRDELVLVTVLNGEVTVTVAGVTRTLTPADGETLFFTEADTLPPVLWVPDDLVITCSQVTSAGRGCAKAADSDIAAWLASATATDLRDPAPIVSHDAPSVLPIGFTTVVFRAVDEAGNVAQRSARIQVIYAFGGFEPPLLKDGSASIQQGRAGRTIPVKFKLICGNGAPVTSAVATIAVYKLLDIATGTIDTTDLTADAGAANDAGNVFRHDGDGQYRYNLSTKGWSAPATYRIIVTLDDGTQHMVDFSLR